MSEKELELLTEIRDLLKRLLEIVEQQRKEQEMANRVFRPEVRLPKRE